MHVRLCTSMHGPSEYSCMCVSMHGVFIVCVCVCVCIYACMYIRVGQ